MKSGSGFISRLFIACFFFAFSQITKAQDIELLGSYEAHTPVLVEISGDYAFLSSLPSYFFVVNIADKYNPYLVNTTQPRYAEAMKIRDNNLYISTNVDFAIYDITDIENPSLIGSVSSPHGEFLGIKGNYVYVTAHQDGVRIIDISDPANPTVSGYYNCNIASYITVDGNYAYLIPNTGIEILDISDPANPVNIGNLSINADWDSRLLVNNNLLFAALNLDGFYVADISDPANPSIINYTPIPCFDISVFQDYAFVAGDSTGDFLVFDISDPASPLLVSRYDAEENPADRVVQDGYFSYVAHYSTEGPFNIYRFTGIGDGVLTGTVTNDQGDPLEGTVVTVINSPFVDTTDVNGHYFLEGFYTDPHDVKFHHPYYPETIITDVNLISGETVVLNVELVWMGNCDYVTGDVNNSGQYNGLDVSYTVSFFKGGPAPVFECECTTGNSWYVAGDVNSSCSFNGLDVTYGIAYLKGGEDLTPCLDCPPRL